MAEKKSCDSPPTSPKSAVETLISDGPEREKSPFVLRAGRPNLKEIVEEQVLSTDYSDYVAVGACGPSAMTQDLANAVSDAIHTEKVLRGEKRRNIVSPHLSSLRLRP